jgi:hypothetical protein
MIQLTIILLTLFIGRLTFDKFWIKKYETMKPLPKIIATGMCMIIAGVSIILLIKMEWWQYIVFFISLSCLWSLSFDPIRNLISGKKFNYMSETTWPDRWILKICNNFYLYTAFRVVIIVFLWGMIRNVEFKNKK